MTHIVSAWQSTYLSADRQYPKCNTHDTHRISLAQYITVCRWHNGVILLSLDSSESASDSFLYLNALHHWWLNFCCLKFGMWIVKISKRISAITGVHKFSKNLGTTSRFYAPKRWQEASSVMRTPISGVPCGPVIWRRLLGSCYVIHIFLCRKNCIRWNSYESQYKI
jgi:hypothetical protein